MRVPGTRDCASVLSGDSGLSGHRVSRPKVTFSTSLWPPEKVLAPGDLCFQVVA